MVWRLSFTKNSDLFFILKFCFLSFWCKQTIFFVFKCGSTVCSYRKSRWLFALYFFNLSIAVWLGRQLPFHHTLPSSYYYITVSYLVVLGSQPETLKLLLNPYSVLNIQNIATTLNQQMDLVKGLLLPNTTSTKAASSPPAIVVLQIYN